MTTVKQLLRLKGLLGLLLIVSLGGWYWLDEYLQPAFENLWGDLIYLWDNATIAGLTRLFVAYISRFGWRMIILEIIKRAMIWYLINYFIVWILPWSWRVQFRWWVREKKDILFGKIRRTRKFLSRDDMFGPYFGLAIWLFLTLIIVTLFYSFFYLWTMIILGFIKFPGFVNRLVNQGIHFVSKVMEKTGLRKILIRVFKSAWTPLTRYLPDWHIISTDEEKKRLRRIERIRQIRLLIKMRKNKELFWQARGHIGRYRELRDEHGHRVATHHLLPSWMHFGKKKPKDQEEQQTAE